MLKRIACVAVICGLGVSIGCSDVKNTDPKPSGTPDSRLKPAETGGSKAPAQQQSLKGD